MNREETVTIFCQRLIEVIERSGLSRSAFAAKLELDRSTLSQLLSPNNERLPRTETILAIAHVAQVSVDWLLGLSQENEPGTALVASALEIEPGSDRPMNERLQLRWHAEAAGYKIRYVPQTVPDLLKTEEVIRFEYQQYDDRVPDLRIEQTEERLAYSRKPETDMEVCTPYQAVAMLARGEGIWRELPRELRRAQLAWMIELLDELYPTLRWFMFDGRQRFSVPYTIFGPQRAALYVGNMFFVFNATDQIRVLASHFDDLIRVSTIQPTDALRYLQQLLDEVGG